MNFELINPNASKLMQLKLDVQNISSGVVSCRDSSLDDIIPINSFNQVKGVVTNEEFIALLHFRNVGHKTPQFLNWIIFEKHFDEQDNPCIVFEDDETIDTVAYGTFGLSSSDFLSITDAYIKRDENLKSFAELLTFIGGSFSGMQLNQVEEKFK